MNATDAQRHYERSIATRGYGLVPQGDDDALAVRFETRAIYLKAKSEQEGRPIYEDRIFALIPLPGGDECHRELKESDKERFWRQWEAFEKGDNEQIIGTPLKMWSPITPAQAESFKYMNVHTVEQLAALSDAHLQDLGLGAQELRRKAKAYLEVSKDAGVAMQQAAENEKLRNEIETLRGQMQDMQSTFMKQIEKKRGRGRPKTENNEAKEDEI